MLFSAILSQGEGVKPVFKSLVVASGVRSDDNDIACSLSNFEKYLSRACVSVLLGSRNDFRRSADRSLDLSSCFVSELN